MFRFGAESGGDSHNKPEFYANDQISIVKRRVPKATYLDAKESEAMMSQYNRMVEIKESFSYEKSLVFQYISYMRNF